MYRALHRQSGTQMSVKCLGQHVAHCLPSRNIYYKKNKNVCFLWVANCSSHFANHVLRKLMSLNTASLVEENNEAEEIQCSLLLLYDNAYCTEKRPTTQSHPAFQTHRRTTYRGFKECRHRLFFLPQEPLSLTLQCIYFALLC